MKLTISEAGEFRVLVTANTPENRQIETTAFLWAPGESPWWAGTAQERVQIVPDKKSYQPGDTAHVLIVTGKEPASVLVTAEGNALYSGQVIRSNGGSVTVDVPDQARVRAQLLCRGRVHPRQQALPGIEEPQRAADAARTEG